MCSARREIGNRDIIWELNLGRPFRARTFKERIFWLHRNYAWQSPLGPVWSLTLSWICLLSLDTKRREENAGLFERLLSFPDPICSRNLCGRKTGQVETEQKSAFLWFFMKKKFHSGEKRKTWKRASCDRFKKVPRCLAMLALHDFLGTFIPLLGRSWPCHYIQFTRLWFCHSLRNDLF